MADMGGVFDMQISDLPEPEYHIIPAGKHRAMAVESGWKPTKDQTTEYLEVKFILLDGDEKGRTISARLNLRHHKSDVVVIAQRQLVQLRDAVGKSRCSDSAELHDIPLLLEIVVKPYYNDKTKLTNDIKGFHSCSSAPTATSPAPSNQARPNWMAGKK